jgi:hypothetical protein
MVTTSSSRPFRYSTKCWKHCSMGVCEVQAGAGGSCIEGIWRCGARLFAPAGSPHLEVPDPQAVLVELVQRAFIAAASTHDGSCPARRCSAGAAAAAAAVAAPPLLLPPLATLLPR